MTDEPRACKEIRRVGAWALKNANDPRNVAKGDWRKMSRRRLTWLFLVEVWELLGAMWEIHMLRRRLPHNLTPDEAVLLKAARRNVQHEIGDCVAFLAFLGDRI